ncbi:MAG: hypothetical protein KGZ88_14395 [Methylomicrobium sp.]|nr:hypothetical protein [Methylomicrobium sp.]PPD19433.1 MAG: hypothetical protein CTY24_10890 [Methylobacter sp.]
MTDFMFFVFTKILRIDLKDPQDIPWGTQLFFYPVIGFLIAFVVLKFMGFRFNLFEEDFGLLDEGEKEEKRRQLEEKRKLMESSSDEK